MHKYSFTQFRPQHGVLSGFVASPCLGRGAADDVAVSAAAAAASVRTDPFNQIRLGETPAAFARDRVRCSLGRRGRPRFLEYLPSMFLLHIRKFPIVRSSLADAKGTRDTHT